MLEFQEEDEEDIDERSSYGDDLSFLIVAVPNVVMDVDGEAEGWTCGVCTFHNDLSHQACSMCYTMRLSSRYRWLIRPLCSCAGRTLLSLSLSNLPLLLATILSRFLTGFFAVVGAFTGAVTGALAGRAEQSGLVRGAGLGAVAGAVLSVEVLEASRAYWHSETSGRSCLSSMKDLVEDLFSGRFVQLYVVPAVSATQQWQLNADDMSYEELYEVFGIGEGRSRGASKEFLERLPQHRINHVNRTDASGDAINCAICLQELEQGDNARSLPTCKHTFHVNCVDKWLMEHVSCPVCRQYI